MQINDCLAPKPWLTYAMDAREVSAPLINNVSKTSFILPHTFQEIRSLDCFPPTNPHRSPELLPSHSCLNRSFETPIADR